MNPNVPDHFLCPITHCIMQNPVIDHEGNTYEKKAIEDWLLNNKTSPLTRQSLSIEQLSPNRALKEAILGMQLVETMDADFVGTEYELKCYKAYAKTRSRFVAMIVPKTSAIRTPVDLSFVIDSSGSMCGMTTVGDIKESTGLSILDVTKHGVRTIMEVLCENDRLAIIEYNSIATVVCPLTYMNASGKALAGKALDSIESGGCTNLWDGLHKGMEELRMNYTGRVSHVMLLTDGQPNRNPPRGHLPMLEMYVDMHPEFSCTVNTYGFGYSLDSELLDSIAHKMNGLYAFIPDSGFVGTIFINSIASILSTGASNATLLLEGKDITSVEGYDLQKTSWGGQIEIGDLPSDQIKTLIIYAESEVSAKLKYKTNGEKRICDMKMEFINFLDDSMRCGLYALIRDCLKDRSNTYKLQQLSNLFDECGGTPEYIEALKKDLNGQVTDGLTDEYFNKWGKHFLLSLSRAHLRQQCLNFKDFGVQFYGGDLFKQIRDEADTAFNKLPVPKSKVYRGVTPATMSSYNYSGGGCFDGEGLVKMADGSIRSIKELFKGDIVCSLNSTAKVVCLIQTYYHYQIEVCTINGIKITPWHPVFIDKWIFPANVAAIKHESIDYVYNVVLDKGHTLDINGLTCITLGHGMKGDVVEHAFFGTDAVINDLKKFDGYYEGFVQLNEECMQRGEDGRVCSIEDCPPPLSD